MLWNNNVIDKKNSPSSRLISFQAFCKFLIALSTLHISQIQHTFCSCQEERNLSTFCVRIMLKYSWKLQASPTSSRTAWTMLHGAAVKLRVYKEDLSNSTPSIGLSYSNMYSERAVLAKIFRDVTSSLNDAWDACARITPVRPTFARNCSNSVPCDGTPTDQPAGLHEFTRISQCLLNISRKSFHWTDE